MKEMGKGNRPPEHEDDDVTTAVSEAKNFSYVVIGGTRIRLTVNLDRVIDVKGLAKSVTGIPEAIEYSGFDPVKIVTAVLHKADDQLFTDLILIGVWQMMRGTQVKIEKTVDSVWSRKMKQLVEDWQINKGARSPRSLTISRITSTFPLATLYSVYACKNRFSSIIMQAAAGSPICAVQLVPSLLSVMPVAEANRAINQVKDFMKRMSDVIAGLTKKPPFTDAMMDNAIKAMASSNVYTRMNVAECVSIGIITTSGSLDPINGMEISSEHIGEAIYNMFIKTMGCVTESDVGG